MHGTRFIVAGGLASFHEAIAAGRIDREAGVIKGVKLMGFESLNNRRYLPPAPSLFEGVKVRVDHYAKEDDPDPPDPMFGDIWATTSNAKVTHEGVFADLTYNKAHTMVPTILWWAEHQPNVGGFSPITWGKQAIVDGETVITIVAVESVDLVDRPATTSGFFEEIHEMDPKEVAKLQESLLAKTNEAAASATKLAETLAANVVLTTENSTLKGEKAALVEADRKAKVRVERLKLITPDLGTVSEEFKEQVVLAPTDAGAAVLVETVRTALGTPRSSGGNPNDAIGGDGKGTTVKNYEEAKKLGLLNY